MKFIQHLGQLPVPGTTEQAHTDSSPRRQETPEGSLGDQSLTEPQRLGSPRAPAGSWGGGQAGNGKMSPAENPLMSLTWAVWLSSHSEGQAGGTCEVEGVGGQSKCEEECGTCMNPAMVEKTYSTKERRGNDQLAPTSVCKNFEPNQPSCPPVHKEHPKQDDPLALGGGVPGCRVPVWSLPGPC